MPRATTEEDAKTRYALQNEFLNFWRFVSIYWIFIWILDHFKKCRIFWLIRILVLRRVVTRVVRLTAATRSTPWMTTTRWDSGYSFCRWTSTYKDSLTTDMTILRLWNRLDHRIWKPSESQILTTKHFCRLIFFGLDYASTEIKYDFFCCN